MEEYLYNDLTFELIGYGYNVFNGLKYGYQEKYYQRAYEQELLKNKKTYSKEHKIKINYHGKIIGRYFIDFLIEDKIIVELKVAYNFHEKHIAQVLAYMRAKQIKIGLILLFTKQGLQIKRLII